MNSPKDFLDTVRAHTIKANEKARIEALTRVSEDDADDAMPEEITHTMKAGPSSFKIKMKKVGHLTYNITDIFDVTNATADNPLVKAYQHDTGDNAPPFSFQVLVLAASEWIEEGSPFTNGEMLANAAQSLRDSEIGEEDIEAFCGFVRNVWSNGV